MRFTLKRTTSIQHSRLCGHHIISHLWNRVLRYLVFKTLFLWPNMIDSSPNSDSTFFNILFNINPLNAELNPFCHLLVLLGDLTFMGPCVVSIFQSTCISTKMQRYTVYLHLETALHVSGSISTHHQKRIQLYLQHLVFVTPLLLSAAIVEEL
jgi:hypothetical protein